MRDLTLKVIDLESEERQILFPNFDTSRTLTIDMAFFRNEPNMEKADTELNRDLGVIRLLDKDKNDPETALDCLPCRLRKYHLASKSAKVPRGAYSVLFQVEEDLLIIRRDNVLARQSKPRTTFCHSK